MVVAIDVERDKKYIPVIKKEEKQEAFIECRYVYICELLTLFLHQSQENCVAFAIILFCAIRALIPVPENLV